MGFELNERFQTAVTAVRKVNVYNGTVAEKTTAYSQLVQCVSDFTRIVKKYGEIIISEISLPLDKKTIKPLPFYGGKERAFLSLLYCKIFTVMITFL